MTRKSGSFKEQMNGIKQERGGGRRQKDQFDGYRFFPVLRHPTKWEEDGVDHINISAMGNTELGPALYVGTRLKFVHAELGEFHSLSNFWGYMETNAATERLRFLSTTARMEELERHERRQVVFISFLILDAAWQRIQQLPPLLEAIRDSELPFDNYFVGENAMARWRRSISPWVVEGYELIREALKNGTEPDFSVFMHGKTRDEIIDITVETHGLRRARTQRVVNGFASNRLMAELNALTKGEAAPRRRQKIHNLRESAKDEPEASSTDAYREVVLPMAPGALELAGDNVVEFKLELQEDGVSQEPVNSDAATDEPEEVVEAEAPVTAEEVAEVLSAEAIVTQASTASEEGETAMQQAFAKLANKS